MRVGLIAPPWAAIPPIGYGRTEAVIDQLARGIQTAGHEVVLFTVADSTCPVPRRHLLATAEGMRIGFCVPDSSAAWPTKKAPIEQYESLEPPASAS